MQYTDRHATHSRLLELAEELSAGCDQDFDAAYDDLEREFAELRLQLGRFE
jgi:hypothetical protein